VFCDSPLQRPNYFSGRLLTEADFTSEQQYQRRKHRSHNLHCQGWGVVHGLKVSVTNDKNGSAVIIKSGVAIDPAGNEVYLCATAKFPLPDSATGIQVGIRWLERPGGCMPVAGSDAEPATMPAYAGRLRGGIGSKANPTTFVDDVFFQRRLRRSAATRTNCPPQEGLAIRP
jgi:hypothetical protein